MGKVRKTTLLKKMQQILCLMYCQNKLVKLVAIQALIYMYSGKQLDSLDRLQYAEFIKIVLTRKNIGPQKLPPTERIAD